MLIHRFGTSNVKHDAYDGAFRQERTSFRDNDALMYTALKFHNGIIAWIQRHIKNQTTLLRWLCHLATVS